MQLTIEVAEMSSQGHLGFQGIPLGPPKLVPIVTGLLELPVFQFLFIDFKKERNINLFHLSVHPLVASYMCFD